MGASDRFHAYRANESVKIQLRFSAYDLSVLHAGKAVVLSQKTLSDMEHFGLWSIEIRAEPG